MDYDRIRKFWDAICDFQQLLWTAFTLTVILLILGAFSFLFVDRNSGSYVLLQIDMVILMVTIVGIAYPLYRCQHRL